MGGEGRKKNEKSKDTGNTGETPSAAPETTVSTGSTGGSGIASSFAGSGSVTSFDILQVSKVFLDYCGGEETFYQKTFDYVISKGLSGSVTGTMSSYDIDADKRTATITIRLSSGGSITCTYDRNSNSFSFSGP